MAAFGRGDVFYIRSAAWGREHMFVVVTDPDANSAGLMLLPCVSSVTPDTEDRSCIIAVGEHPFIKVESFVAYRFTKALTSTDLNALLADKTTARLGKASMPLQVVDRMVEGARISRQFPKRFLTLLPPPTPPSDEAL